MKKLLNLSVIGILLTLSACNNSTEYRECEICIYGATSAGVIAARTAAAQNRDVILIEPTQRIGGLSAGGLGQTDIGNKQVVEGLSKEFYRRLGRHYGKFESWIFEPSAALKVFQGMLDEVNVKPLYGWNIESTTQEDGKIKSIVIRNGNGELRAISAKYFIDCTYEGDLMAKAGVSYVVGRESNETYNETWNGVQLLHAHQFPDGIDPYIIEGQPESGLLWGISDSEVAPNGTGDSLVQAYNFRICLTDNPDNRIAIERPLDYDSSHYELLARLIAKQPQKEHLNDYFIWSPMPNQKSDVNNLGGFSTDAIGMNVGYVEGSLEQRQKIYEEHKSYTLGLLYFMAHDPRVPKALRQRVAAWGLPKDEYQDNGNWTPQLYVREARRMIGEYVVTQSDCQGYRRAEDYVAMAAYTMDSHNCQRIVIKKNGVAMVKNEGNVEVGGFPPYPISYRAILPKKEESKNLLVPVALSASHIAYGSIRMEPVFMVLGQAAAVAACSALEEQSSIHSLRGEDILKKMRLDPLADGSIPDIIVDDRDVKLTENSSWKRIGWGYGPSAYYLEPDSPREDLVYTMPIKKGGRYALYTYYHRNADASQIMKFDVRDCNKSYYKEINRDTIHIEGQTRGIWLPLGEYQFEDNSLAEIKYLTENSEGRVYADALQLIYLD